MDVFCDYCGAKLDVEHENCCTQCGAPFDNNAGHYLCGERGCSSG